MCETINNYKHKFNEKLYKKTEIIGFLYLNLNGYMYSLYDKSRLNYKKNYTCRLAV